MAIRIEWIKNKAKEKIYAVSHAKAVFRGNSTVDKDLTTLESTVKTIQEDVAKKADGAMLDKINKRMCGITFYEIEVGTYPQSTIATVSCKLTQYGIDESNAYVVSIAVIDTNDGTRFFLNMLDDFYIVEDMLYCTPNDKGVANCAGGIIKAVIAKIS